MYRSIPIIMSGTDLSMAYGSPYETPNKPKSYSQSYDGENRSTYKDPALKREPIRNVDLPLPKMSSAPPENPSYKVPEEVYAKQGTTMEEDEASGKYSSRAPRDSFWDKIGRKKADVLKVFVLSLIIVLGISIDHISKHYLDSYVAKSFLTETQELLVRLSYPVLIVLIIWIIKATS